MSADMQSLLTLLALILGSVAVFAVALLSLLDYFLDIEHPE